MSTETWGVALLVLAAVLVGAALPVLLQLRATLRVLEQTLARSGPRLDEALLVSSAAAARLDALAARLGSGHRIEEMLEGVASVGRAATQLKDTIRVASAVGAAVGPAVAALITALRTERAEAPAASQSPPEAAPDAAHDPRKQATS